MIPKNLVERARRAGAMGNVENARDDLLRWPELLDRIIGDLIQAIECHEQKPRIPTREPSNSLAES